MEAEGAHGAQCPKLAAAIGPEDGMGRILDDGDGPRHRQDRVHVAGDPAIVHDHDGAGARRDQGRDPGRVDVEGVGLHVGEQDARAPQQEGVGRGAEGIGGNDDLVAGRDFEGQGRQFQSVRAGGREGGVANTKPGL